MIFQQPGMISWKVQGLQNTHSLEDQAQEVTRRDRMAIDLDPTKELTKILKNFRPTLFQPAWQLNFPTFLFLQALQMIITGTQAVKSFI